ncbi:SAM-dependent methyltransferase [Lewinella aquimaris]|uniref:SAM-dependent methyltransferase n=1 Tax=Neolewinella aquimaris TaxID=1835722 RepID=A0A840EHU0_9BACT|nr:fused MFS/spermidine synthase [Neolewinella aquimaris]MBB4080466.1 SAM-dependent methyltransferase [Neolewinella aquimaris]
MSKPAHISRLRYWLSYLWEQRLETTASVYNDYLEVCVVHGRLQLVAEDAIYSFGDYYLNFRKLFEIFDFERLPERASVLVLGLGLGSIPELLEKYIGLEYSYVAVEIDAAIIELASKYSLPALDSPIEVVEADAFAFLQLDERRFDLICVDVFQNANVPDHLNGTTFIELCQERLLPGGALVYNRLASSIPDRNAARSYFEDVFAPAFPAPKLHDTGGNYLLLNDGSFLNLPA